MKTNNVYPKCPCCGTACDIVIEANKEIKKYCECSVCGTRVNCKTGNDRLNCGKEVKP